MTVGAVWLIVFSLAMFLWASGLVWAFGILDAAFHDVVARVILIGLYVITWVIPSLIAWASWWFHS